MTGTIQIDDKLFDGGPPLRAQKTLGIVKPGLPRVAWRAKLAVLIGWIPLLLLVMIEELVLRNGVARSFYSDYAVHARCLIATPLFILAESDCIPRLGNIARQFLTAGVIREPDRGRFYEAIDSTRRLLDSRAAGIITALLSFALIALVVLNVASSDVPAWRRSEMFEYQSLSLAGWWHALVSLPMMLILFFGWLWRVFLWGRFLFLVARLDLRLIPSHPDQAGGLLFISTSLRGFGSFVSHSGRLWPE